MPCYNTVPISIIPPTGQGQGPLVWQNGSQINRLNLPLNPSWLVFDGSKTRWADGSVQSPIYLPSLQYVSSSLIYNVIGITQTGVLAKTVFSPFIPIASAKTYYIAARSDDAPGTGTIADPYNGSTQVKFDALFANPNTINCIIPQNCVVKLFEGTYYTNGIVLPNGTGLIGDGPNTTTIRLNARSSVNGGTYTKVISAFGDNVTISGLTVDGNWQNLKQANSKVDLISIAGTGTGANALCINSKITDCNIINFGGDVVTGQESFPVVITGTNAIISNCKASGLVNNIGQTQCYTTVFSIGGINIGTTYYYASGKITNNYALGNGNLAGGFGAIGGAIFDNLEISYNTFVNLSEGIHGDSWQNRNLTIKNNKFVNCRRAIGIDYSGTANSSNAPDANGSYVGASSLTGCIIDSNVFYLCNNTDSGGFNGISLYATAVKNLEIRNNVVRGYNGSDQQSGYFTIATPPCSNVYIHDNIIYKNIGSTNCLYQEQVIKEYNNTDEAGIQRFDVSGNAGSITVKSNSIAPIWTYDIPYTVNSYVYFNGNTYRNLSGTTISAFQYSPDANASWTLANNTTNGGEFINGLSLVNAMLASSSATPYGNAKSPTNRFTIELEAGVYSIPSTSNVTNPYPFSTIIGKSSSKSTIVKCVNGTTFDLVYNNPDWVTFENITIMGSGSLGSGLLAGGFLITFSNWSSSVAYPVPSSSTGGYVYYNGTLYQNLSGSTIASGQANPSTNASWTAVPIWVNATYANYRLVSYNGIVYQNKTGSNITANVAPNATGSTWTVYTDWSISTTYASSDLVFYNGKVYQNTYTTSVTGYPTPDSLTSYWSRYLNSNCEFNNVHFSAENSGTIIGAGGYSLAGTLKNCTSDAPFINDSFNGSAFNCIFGNGFDIIINGNLLDCTINGPIATDTENGYFKNCIINSSGINLGGNNGFSGTLDSCELINVRINPSSKGTAQIINTTNIFNAANTLANTYSIEGTGSVSIVNYYSNLPINSSISVTYLGAGNYVTATGTSTSLSTGSPDNITASTISLIAGEWDISADVNFVATGATTTLANPFIGGISTTSGTLVANQQFQFPVTAIASSFNITGAVPTTRLVLTTTTSIYLVAKATFSAGSINATGVIRARQIH